MAGDGGSGCGEMLTFDGKGLSRMDRVKHRVWPSLVRGKLEFGSV